MSTGSRSKTPMNSTQGPVVQMLDTFLFDLGGVLVDDLDLNYNSSIGIFKMLGKGEITKEEYLANLLPIQKLYQAVGLSEEESKRSSALFKESMMENVDSIVLQPDATPTLQMLRQEKMKCGLVTQYPRLVAHQIISKLDLSSYFDTVVGFEDSDEQKPSAKPVLIALDRLESSPDTSLFVGDMKQDIIAGHNAGVVTVGVYRGRNAYHTRDVLREANPSFLIESLNELTRLLSRPFV